MRGGGFRPRGITNLVSQRPHKPSSARWSRSSEPRRTRPEPGCCPCGTPHTAGGQVRGQGSGGQVRGSGQGPGVKLQLDLLLGPGAHVSIRDSAIATVQYSMTFIAIMVTIIILTLSIIYIMILYNSVSEYEVLMGR